MSQAGEHDGATIDGLEFARAGGEQTGSLDASRLPRLTEAGCGVDEIAYRIRGGFNRDGRPCLRVQASGTLRLMCQRCLDPMALAVSVDAELELSESLEAIETAEDDVDRVLASRSMDVAALVEDELILELPFAPKHEACEVVPMPETKRFSPFDVLEQLKKRPGAN